jgi:hypothetical protein
MGSTGGDVAWVGHEQQRPVWVSLSTIFARGEGPSSPAAEVDGIDTTAESPGLLLHWLRASSGEWLGVVTYPVRFADGTTQPIYLERQVVPAHALRPRT